MKHKIYMRPSAPQLEATGGEPTTVGQYLVDRLFELGLEHLFSIPGDYTVEWVDRYVVPSKKILCHFVFALTICSLAAEMTASVLKPNFF